MFANNLQLGCKINNIYWLNHPIYYSSCFPLFDIIDILRSSGRKFGHCFLEIYIDIS
uniref:Uncharacterized protein n=1 Tax=Arundo donax TaxID=35708 RepID=A0A0A8Z1W8_ARUDO